ncbi:hypothetical protein ABE485_06380 [Achromobacter spanius]|uniref:hypothetical protein n=1 Tax=Achromobacter spanius TaxID=217203 RepID=UPI00320A4BD2
MSILGASAATIGDSLDAEVGYFLLQTGQRRHKKDGEVQRLWAECEKLARADAPLAMALKAALCVTVGDYDEALYYVRNIKLNHSPLHDSTLATVLINFGYFSESLEVYRQLLSVRELVQDEYFHLGVANGAYSTYIEALEAYRKNMSLSSFFPAMEDEVRAAAAILEENGESEQLIARAMDVAGEVLRDRSLLFYGLHHKVRAVPHPRDGGPPYFRVDIGVQVDDDTAFDMTCEYADRLAQSSATIPVSMVLKFSGRSESHA